MLLFFRKSNGITTRGEFFILNETLEDYLLSNCKEASRIMADQQYRHQHDSIYIGEFEDIKDANLEIARIKKGTYLKCRKAVELIYG
jgi:hypothetical protein